MCNFWFNKAFVYHKLLGLINKNGLREKSEKALLSVFKQVDYFIIFEIMFKIRSPFRFYVKKRRIGRHSFKYFNSLVFVLNTKEQHVAIRNFYLLLKSLNLNSRGYSFKDQHFINVINDFVQNGGGVLLLNKVQRYKQALFLKAIRHYR